MTDATNDATVGPLRCLLRALAFVAGFALIVGVLYTLGSSRYETTQIRSDRENLGRMETGTLLVLGSSHGFSLVVEEMGAEGANLSHGGQDAFEMAYMARAVKRAAPALTTVIFTLSYFTFAFDNAAYVQAGTQTRVGRRVGMYAAFPSFGFVPGDGSSYLKGLLYPVVTSDHWRRVLLPAAGGDGHDDEDGEEEEQRNDLLPSARLDRQVATEQSIATHAKRRCSQYRKLMRNMTSRHEDLDDDVYAYLHDVSGELERAGVRVVFVTPPYYATYNACFDGKRQALTRRLGKRLAKETGAEYIDAGRLPEFSDERSFFRNSDHMNRAGKVAFSRWLARRLAGDEGGELDD